MKRIIKCLIVLLIVTCINTNALTVYDNNIEVKPGDTTVIDIYGNYLDNNGFELQTNGDVTVSYEPVLTCSSGEAADCVMTLTKDDGLVKIGELTITIASDTESKLAKVYLGGNVINITINKNANLKKETKEKESEASEVESDTLEDEEELLEEEYTNLLQSIKSKYASIVLENGVYEYTITIDSDLTKLDLTPVAYNDNAEIEISSQIISELEDNKIYITVTDGDTKEEYIITVKIETTEKDITIAPTPKKEYSLLGICVIVVTAFCVITYLGRIKKGMKRRRRRGRN